MSITGKGFQYLNLLADFWTVFYSDAVVLETLLKTEAEIVKSMYFSFLQQQLPRAVQDSSIFEEQFWNIIELIYEDTTFQVVKRKGVTYYSYLLDEAYAHIPQLYNVIFNPTIRLKEKKDYIIERTISESLAGDSDIPVVESRILFKEDPFLNNDIAKRINAENKYSIVMFAPKVFIDDMRLFEMYGSLLNIVSVGSEEYKAFLTGLMYIFTNGPSIGALNAGLSLAAGYPVARASENIINVRLEEEVFSLISDLGNTYEFPRKIVPQYNSVLQVVEHVVFPTIRCSGVPYSDALGNINNTVDLQDPLLVDGLYPTFFPVDRMDPFISDVRVVDWRTEKAWWRKQVGKLSSTLVPGLPEQLKSNPMIKDYLFDTYFKHNTFGVFIDYRVFRADFDKTPDFLGILKQVKPTYKSFVVYEDDLSVFTIVKLNPSPVSLQGSVLNVPIVDQVVLGDGTIVSSPPRTTVIPTPIIDPISGLPVDGINPITGQPYPPGTDIKNVFDAVGLRNFLDIFDIYGIEKYISMNLPLDNLPIQIGIALEDIHHSLDIVGLSPTMLLTDTISLAPSIEPIMGMEFRLGMCPDEGLLERISLGMILNLEDTGDTISDSPATMYLISGDIFEHTFESAFLLNDTSLNNINYSDNNLYLFEHRFEV